MAKKSSRTRSRSSTSLRGVISSRRERRTPASSSSSTVSSRSVLPVFIPVSSLMRAQDLLTVMPGVDPSCEKAWCEASSFGQHDISHLGAQASSRVRLLCRSQSGCQELASPSHFGISTPTRIHPPGRQSDRLRAPARRPWSDPPVHRQARRDCRLPERAEQLGELCRHQVCPRLLHR